MGSHQSKQQGYANGCDGTRLFFQSSGQGPAMIACNGIGVSTFFWRQFRSSFVANYKFITWDYRGHGRSDPPADPARVSIETLADDLHQIATHLNVSRPILLGHSMGVQVILEYYRRYSKNVGALIPVLGSYEKPVDSFMNFPLSRSLFDGLLKFSKIMPHAAKKFHRMAFDPRYAIAAAGFLGLIDRLYCPKERMREYFEHIGSLNTEMLLAMGESMADHSARDVLQEIKVPTLIVAGENDLLTPIHLSLEMHRQIPGADLLYVRRGTHTSLIEQPEFIIEGIDKFLRNRGLHDRTPESAIA